MQNRKCDIVSCGNYFAHQTGSMLVFLHRKWDITDLVNSTSRIKNRTHEVLSPRNPCAVASTFFMGQKIKAFAKRKLRRFIHYRKLFTFSSLVPWSRHVTSDSYCHCSLLKIAREGLASVPSDSTFNHEVMICLVDYIVMRVWDKGKGKLYRCYVLWLGAGRALSGDTGYGIILISGIITGATKSRVRATELSTANFHGEPPLDFRPPELNWMFSVIFLRHSPRSSDVRSSN